HTRLNTERPQVAKAISNVMTIQVKPVYRKPEEGQGLPGRVLDKDDTQRLLIKARSSVLHMEAGYTTDNLLLSLTVECLAMREETIYVPPSTPFPGCRAPARRRPQPRPDGRRSAGALHPEHVDFLQRVDKPHQRNQQQKAGRQQRNQPPAALEETTLHRSYVSHENQQVEQNPHPRQHRQTYTRCLGYADELGKEGNEEHNVLGVGDANHEAIQRWILSPRHRTGLPRRFNTGTKLTE